jgi:hypothetical protein
MTFIFGPWLHGVDTIVERYIHWMEIAEVYDDDASMDLIMGMFKRALRDVERHEYYATWREA